MEEIKTEEALHDCLERLQKQLEQDNPILYSHTIFAKLICLLREVVLTHRWTEVMHILNAFSANAQTDMNPLHNLGIEVFLQEPSTSSSLVLLRKLVEQLNSLKTYDANEVVVEYLLYIMVTCQHELESIHHDIKIFSKRGPRPQYQVKTNYFENLQKGYKGLVHYIEWCKLTSKLDQTAQQNFLPGAEDPGLIQHCQRACECFSACERQHGVWDIFVSKHIMMLEYHGKQEEAEKIIENYVKTDEDNPYPLKLLFEFYTRNNYSTALQISILEKLCKKVGYSKLSLSLYKMYKKNKDSHIKKLPILFNLLDYPQWKDNVKVWKYLSSELTKISHIRNDATLEEQWQHRKDWWLPYHFTEEKTSSSLQYYKALVAVYLYGCEIKYVQQLLEQGCLDSEQKKGIEKARRTWDLNM